MAEHVQTSYRRNLNPMVAGQTATGRDHQFDSGRLLVGGTNNYPATIPFGHYVGWVDGPDDENGRTLLKGNACALHIATSGTGQATIATNFAGIAHRNVALPGANTPVEGAPTGTERVLDAYNENDLVSIGSEGDFVVVCSAAVSRGSNVNVITTAGADKGKFIGGTTSGTRPLVPGAIFMTDSTEVTPYSGGSAQHLAVMRVRLQPR